MIVENNSSQSTLEQTSDFSHISLGVGQEHDRTDYLSLCWNFNIRAGNGLQDSVPHRKSHIVSKTQFYSALHLLELKILISFGSTSSPTMICSQARWQYWIH